MKTYCARITSDQGVRPLVLLLLLGTAAVFVTGCPIQVSQYDLGYTDGFAKDDWYWQGYDDSFSTIGASPVYYQGSTIPSVTSPEYDAGYWDGVWYAYNDGYFVSYDDAFTIGFSEGYDAAFFADYLNFLASDQHVEFNNGGWDDGYNDGFSEGRVFGANDFEQGLPFDWLDALEAYRGGQDLCFDEISVCTGTSGPVVLYVYGTDPLAKDAGAKSSRIQDRTMPSIRSDSTKAAPSHTLSYRPFPQAVQDELAKTPATTPRSSRDLNFTTTWFERIEEARQANQAQ